MWNTEWKQADIYATTPDEINSDTDSGVEDIYIITLPETTNFWWRYRTETNWPEDSLGEDMKAKRDNFTQGQQLVKWKRHSKYSNRELIDDIEATHLETVVESEMEMSILDVRC